MASYIALVVILPAIIILIQGWAFAWEDEDKSK